MEFCKKGRPLKRLEAIAATLFGLAFLLLSFAVAVETVGRKVFNVSLQGVDELGGYVLAIGSAMAMLVALAGRAHVRIDLLHDMMPRFARVTLNTISILAIALSALVLVRMAHIAWSDSVSYNSTAQTPWATPLKYPQALWLASLALFAVFACVLAGKLVVSLVRGDIEAVDRDFSPKGTKDEVAEELEDIQARGAVASAMLGHGDKP